MIRRYKGMILAAGLGTRLIPLTNFLAKPAIPFLNKPLVQYSMDLLGSAGIQDIAVNLHYLPETVREALKDTGASLRFSHEPEILGTAGGIRKLRDFFQDSPIVLINGKIYFEGDLKEILAFHEAKNALVTMVVVPRTGNEYFNPVFVDQQSCIAGFRKGYSPPQEQTANYSQWVYTGIQVIDPEVLKKIPAGFSDTVRDIYPALIREKRVAAFVSKSYWCECSTPERYLSKSVEVLQKKGLQNLGYNISADGCDKVISDTRVKIPRSSRINRAVLWDQVELGEGCSISNCILIGPITLPDHFKVENSIVSPLISDPSGKARKFSEHGFMIWPLKTV